MFVSFLTDGDLLLKYVLPSRSSSSSIQKTARTMTVAPVPSIPQLTSAKNIHLSKRPQIPQSWVSTHWHTAIYSHSVHTSVIKSAPNPFCFGRRSISPRCSRGVAGSEVPSHRELQITTAEQSVLWILQIQGYGRLREGEKKRREWVCDGFRCWEVT